MSENANLSRELSYDQTDDNNLRFVGNTASNYVLFNDELWRVIGVMNNVLLEDGTSTSLLKIIRNDSIGSYSFDSGLYKLVVFCGSFEIACNFPFFILYYGC